MQTSNVMTIDPALHGDDDVWIDACQQCGTFDNFGDLECRRCDPHQ